MTVQAVPEGYGTVTPWIITPDTAQLIAYVKRAFGAEELARVLGEGNRIEHAEVRTGDSLVTEVTHLFFGDRVGRVMNYVRSTLETALPSSQSMI